jgi:DNA polymerase III subunit epsilon
MILFFDTETTGFPDRQMPLDHACQPAIVQIASILTDDEGVERALCYMLVQPIERTVSASAAAKTGITTEIAQEFGVYPTSALYMWDRMAQMAERIVAYNAPFDREMLDIMWTRFNPARRATPSDFDARHPKDKWFCAMEAATPIVNLPPTERMIAAGFNKPKPPKLEESIQHFFGEPLTGTHDALVDVRATARLYFHLQTLKAAA